MRRGRDALLENLPHDTEPAPEFGRWRSTGRARRGAVMHGAFDDEELRRPLAPATRRAADYGSCAPRRPVAATTPAPTPGAPRRGAPALAARARERVVARQGQHGGRRRGPLDVWAQTEAIEAGACARGLPKSKSRGARRGRAVQVARAAARQGVRGDPPRYAAAAEDEAAEHDAATAPPPPPASRTSGAHRRRHVWKTPAARRRAPQTARGGVRDARGGRAARGRAAAAGAPCSRRARPCTRASPTGACRGAAARPRALQESLDALCAELSRLRPHTCRLPAGAGARARARARARAAAAGGLAPPAPPPGRSTPGGRARGRGRRRRRRRRAAPAAAATAADGEYAAMRAEHDMPLSARPPPREASEEGGLGDAEAAPRRDATSVVPARRGLGHVRRR